ncbi:MULTISPECIES: TIGR02757 family protein [unclassified Helicobacter]|uniref:TIGR02757 family protein n=1 Tax=unclassified Helicobacter TaxID=2593540 RepID=UPI0013154A9E|nr:MULTISPECIES: TIGR02757 family protein [unclassified Helicobacter]
MRDILEAYYHNRNQNEDFSTPDPLIVVRRYVTHPCFELIALACALFSYGRADSIVKFLQKLDFNLLQTDLATIKKANFPKYRFQSSQDIKEFFCILFKVHQSGGIKSIMIEGYKKDGIFGAINAGIDKLYGEWDCLQNSKGMKHLLSTPIPLDTLNSSPKKRWNLFLRWMVRKDLIDFGLWEEIPTRDLILPLDTHIFSICKKLKLSRGNTPNLKFAVSATQSLKKFDSNDPVKYDFALYRIGQEKQQF